MQSIFLKSITEAERAIREMKNPECLDFLQTCSRWIVECLSKEGKLLIAGNGGSLCDAMHFAEELTGFFRKKRRPLGAIALADPGHMSCVSNDEGFHRVFSRQIRALARREDLCILLSTSGNSQNLVEAAKAAKELGIAVIGFLGKDGGKLANLCDLSWIVKGFSYSDRIQEAHMAAIHMIIEAVEEVVLEAQEDIELAPKTSR